MRLALQGIRRACAATAPTVVLVCVALVPGGVSASPPIRYGLSPVFTTTGLADVEVVIRLRGDASGRTTIVLPTAFAGTKDLWRRIDRFSAQGATVEKTADGERLLRHRPRAAVVVRYRVHTAYDVDPPGGANPYAGAVIRPTWFHALGEELFATPQGRDRAPATLAWRRWPAAWRHVDNTAGRTVAVEELVETTLLASPNLAVFERPIDGGVLRLGILGADATAGGLQADRMAAILSAQRRFWGDVSGPYTVTQIPLAPTTGSSSSGGTGRAGGFALYATPDIDGPRMLWTLAHEHVHTWIPQRIGRLAETDEAAGYWFSEGFTDFYAARTLARSGIWSADAFVDDLDAILREYASSPLRDAPNARIVADFWRDPAAQRLPYLRGRLFAFVLEARLRAASDGRQGLDASMFAMRDRWRAAPSSAKPLALDNLAATVPADVDLPDLLARYIDRGEDIVLAADTFGACGRIDVQRVATFDAGFDRQASATANVITGVDPDGPAYRAGLRDGMRRLARVGGEEGNADVPLGYRVADVDGERVIAYLPRGRTDVDVQQVARTPRTSSAGCRAVFSGLRADVP